MKYDDKFIVVSPVKTVPVSGADIMTVKEFVQVSIRLRASSKKNDLTQVVVLYDGFFLKKQ